MKISIVMVTIGLFLLGISVGTMESDLNRFSMPIGISLGIIGSLTLFFSDQQHRNPAWLKRQVKYLIWRYWPAAS